MKYIYLIVGSFLSVQIQAGEVTNSVSLAASNSPDLMFNPACSNGVPTTASEVMPKIAAVVNTYIGHPIVANTPGITTSSKNWLSNKFGENGDNTTCATVCVVAPSYVNVNYRACMTDHHGESCQGGDGETKIGWSEITGLSTAIKADSFLICATGKNWKQDRERFFRVDAWW